MIVIDAFVAAACHPHFFLTCFDWGGVFRVPVQLRNDWISRTAPTTTSTQ